ncbi:MAG: LysR family transcriptional regulator [Acidimicrobiales bacterium]
MELRVVRYFVAVAECGSVSEAARVVRVGQPSLSRQLHLLERELHVKLFLPGPGRLRLSAAGWQFLPIARDLVSRHELALMTMRALSGEGPARITIAAPSTTISDVVAPFLVERVNPDTVFIAREEAADTGYRAVAEGRADISLTIRRPPEEFLQREVARFRLFAYVAKAHPWFQRRSVRLEELSGPPLIVIPGSSSFRILVPALERTGLGFRIAFEVSVPKIAQALAGAGHGVAILSDDPCFGLRPLDIEGPEGILSVPLFAGWDATHYARDTIEQFVDDLAGYCEANWPSPPTPTRQAVAASAG